MELALYYCKVNIKTVNFMYLCISATLMEPRIAMRYLTSDVKSVLARATGVTGIGAIASGIAYTTPSIAGFSVSGVVAHSAAAAWQSHLGNVAAYSTFATLQSFGTTTPLAPVIGPTLVVVGVVAVCAVRKFSVSLPKTTESGGGIYATLPRFRSLFMCLRPMQVDAKPNTMILQGDGLQLEQPHVKH